jgi:heptaprenyl diphosphate synthase
VIAASARSGKLEFLEYSTLLDERYKERFRFGRRFLQTQDFAWRLLEETFQLEGELFSHYRRAIFDLGYNKAAGNPVKKLSGEMVSTFGGADAFFALVEDRLRCVLAQEFPLVGRLLRNWREGPERLLRIITYWQVARWGESTSSKHIQAAACVELAHFGHMIFKHIESVPRGRAPGDARSSTLKWANAFSVMAGDFLLAKAHSLAAELGSESCRLLAQTSAQLCRTEILVHDAQHARHPDPDEYLRSLRPRATAFYELACKMACALAGVPPSLHANLIGFAQCLGVLVHLAGEIEEYASLHPAAYPQWVSSRSQRSVWTLPLILAIEAVESELGDISGVCQGNVVLDRAVGEVLQRRELKEAVLNRVRQPAAQATFCISALPESESRRDMLELVDQLVITASAPVNAAKKPVPVAARGGALLSQT